MDKPFIVFLAVFICVGVFTTTVLIIELLRQENEEKIKALANIGVACVFAILICMSLIGYVNKLAGMSMNTTYAQDDMVTGR